MKPISQQFDHDLAAGIFGDCERACYASILDKTLEEVPHFLSDGNFDGVVFTRKVRNFLSEFGLYSFNLAFQGDLQDVLNMMGMLNPGVHYLVGVGSPKADHCVVAKDNKIVHDPAGYEPSKLTKMSDGYVWITIIGKKL